MKIKVVSLKGVLYSGEGKSFNVPTQSGEITVLDHHRPLITILKKGSGKITNGEGKENKFEIAGGFLEVNTENEVVALVD